MKHKILESTKIPEEIFCEYSNGILKCKKGSVELSRKINLPEANLKIQNGEIIIEIEKGNKNHLKLIRTYLAHINNIFAGLQEQFVYELEAVNVHFPMTLKVEKDELIISNFLGEKTPRHAKILPNVNVNVKGQKITVSSHDKEAAGQTAANFEKAGTVKGKDRRIFQDGIFLVEKPGRKN